MLNTGDKIDKHDNMECLAVDLPDQCPDTKEEEYLQKRFSYIVDQKLRDFVIALHRIYYTDKCETEKGRMAQRDRYRPLRRARPQGVA